MTDILTPVQLADKIIGTTKFPTSDGVHALPLNLEQVRTLIARAVTEDRDTGVRDFTWIAKKVLEGTAQGQVWSLIGLENMITLALRYAQASGARFKQNAPNETDYVEGVQNAIEAFCTTLKDKGLWP